MEELLTPKGHFESNRPLQSCFKQKWEKGIGSRYAKYLQSIVAASQSCIVTCDV